jgi:hypothetical protein
MKTEPFICSECGSGVNYNEGGKCNKCNKLFCIRHLYKTVDGHIFFLCKSCKLKMIKKKQIVAS